VQRAVAAIKRDVPGEKMTGYGGPKTVHIDTVTFRVVTEASARIAALEAGQASEAAALCQGHAEQMADILTGRLKAVISNAA